jgi:hypothetical protein
MTKDDVIEMARKAGMIKIDQDGLIEHFERFASLVAAKEREECAQLCDWLYWDCNIEGAVSYSRHIRDRQYSDKYY